MKVAILSHNAQAGDAIGNQIAEKIAFFLDRGATVRVFVESEQRLHPDVRAQCVLWASPGPEGPEWDYLRTSDLLIVEYGRYYPMLALLPLLAEQKPRILFDYHGVTPPRLWTASGRDVLERSLEQRGLAWFADQALVHSHFMAEELRTSTQIPASRITILGHPVDRDRFYPESSVPTNCRNDTAKSGPRLLYVGRVAPNKRVPVLVEAVARLRADGCPAEALIVGDTGDIYQTEADHCRRRAQELGVAAHVRWLGRLADAELRETYRSADVFVMPSEHEGFAIPLVEAMACGLPVIAARAAALPETVGDAGLTFTPGDAADLARQIRRVVEERLPEAGRPARSDLLHVAVVAFRYGTQFVGGAETSLRRLAQTLHRAGHAVEVFTTCTSAEHDWSNQLPPGTVADEGISVHRFRLDDHDREAHLASLRPILQGDGAASEDQAHAYVRHSIHSSDLIEALGQCADRLDAIVVGPYLFGLTHDVASRFPDQTLLVPCFHDEPLAHLSIWKGVYAQVGGILYHSPEEKQFAEIRLGINHPGAVCLGTYVEPVKNADARRGRHLVATGKPYVVYCGRYSREKNLPTLLEFAGRYAAAWPDRFTFVFLGQGEVPIPKESWARDLGFVTEADKSDVLAGASALIQPSSQESLSLVALEAWAQGTPVMAHEASAVLCGHLRRSLGGAIIRDYETFAAALGDLWSDPEAWQARGRQGQAYVAKNYGNATEYRSRLEAAIRDLATTLRERMRSRGLARAQLFDRDSWREQFAHRIETLLDAAPLERQDRMDIQLRGPEKTVRAGSGSSLIAVRLINRGTQAVVTEGPGRVVIRAAIVEPGPNEDFGEVLETPLPGLLLPGQAVAANVRIPVPTISGVYQLRLWAARQDTEVAIRGSETVMTVEAREQGTEEPGTSCAESLSAVQTSLTEADLRRQLPEDYVDVTTGRFAAWKRWLKRKLLGNFKNAYVDVLSRQQSAVNRHLVTAIQELAECCALLDHARRLDSHEGPSGGAKKLPHELLASVEALAQRLSETQRRQRDLEARLERLERERSSPTPANL